MSEQLGVGIQNKHTQLSIDYILRRGAIRLHLLGVKQAHENNWPHITSILLSGQSASDVESLGHLRKLKKYHSLIEEGERGPAEYPNDPQHVLVNYRQLYRATFGRLSIRRLARY